MAGWLGRWIHAASGGVLALSLVVLAACSAGRAPASSGDGSSSSAANGASDTATTAQLTPEDHDTWKQVVAAARKEGEVQWSATQSAEWIDEVAARFQAKYGIKTSIQITRPPDFNARYAAELAANKQSTDIRTGGGPTMRELDARKLTASFGKLPMMAEPRTTWREDPWVDIGSGQGHSVFYALSGYYLIANNQLCPPDNCPRSYKDLADPKYKGKILLNEPLPAGGSPGMRWAAYTYLEYGEDYLRAVADNVAAIAANNGEALKQIARGEYALYVMNSGAPVDILTLPKPHSFRLIVPEDGQMVLLSGISFLQQAPHPNAGKLLANYLVSQEAQQIMAHKPGEVFLRTDVTPADPELVKISDKLFSRNPDTFEFAATYSQYLPFIDAPLKARGIKQ